MAGEIGSAFIRIRPNTAGFQSEAKSGLAGAFGSIAKLAAEAFAAKAAFDFGKEIVQSAAQVQKSVETIKSSFGSAGDAVASFGEHGAEQLGISAKVADDTSARFGILFRNLGIGTGAAATMTVGFEKLTGSLSAIRGVDPSEVMNKIVLAAAGNTRGLKQLGISIDQVQIKQEALKLGLIKNVKDGINPAIKAQAIYALATQHLGDFQKQAAAHSGDLINVQRRLSAEWSNAKDRLGAGLLPIMARLTGFFADILPGAMKIAGEAAHAVADQVRAAWGLVAPVLQPVVDAAKGVADAFKSGGISAAFDKLKTSFENLSTPGKIIVGIMVALAAQFAIMLGGALPLPLILIAVGEGFKYAYDHSAKLRTAIGDLIGFFSRYRDIILPLAGAIGGIVVAMKAWEFATAAWSAITKAAIIVQTAFDGVLDANPIGLVVLAIAGLVGALVVLYERSDTARRIINDAFHGIQVAVQDVAQAVSAVWRRVSADVLNVAQVTWGAIRDFVAAVLKTVEDIVKLFGDLIHGRWSKIWGDVEKVAKDVWKALLTYFRGQVDVLVAVFKAIGDQTLKALSDAWDAMKEVALEAALAIIEPFSHLPGFLGNKAREAKNAMLKELDSLKKPAGDAGTATGTAFGQNMLFSATPFLNQLGGSVQTALGNVSQGVAAGFGNVLSGAGSLGGDAMSKFIAAQAKKRGLDARAVLSIVGVEGGTKGSVGDGGHAFGPFQLNNAGGVISKMFPGQNNPQAQAFANSKQGVNFALDRIAAVAKGLGGLQAISAIASQFERPKDVPGEISKAASIYFAGMKDKATAAGTGAGQSAADALAAQIKLQLTAQNAFHVPVDAIVKKTKAPKLTSVGADVAQSFLLGLTSLPANLSTKLKDALETGRKAVQSQQTKIAAAFGTAGTESIKAFDGATTAGLDKMKVAFDAKIKAAVTEPLKTALRAAADANTAALSKIDKEAKDAMRQLDASNKAALAGIDKQQKTLTPTEQIIADMQAQKKAADEAAQLAQDQAAVASAADPAARAAAQKQVDDDLFNQRVEALQATADAERVAQDAAADQQRLAQQDVYQTAQDAINATADQQRQAQQDSYQTTQDGINAKYDAIKAGLDKENQANVDHYNALRAQQKTNLEAQLTELEKQLEKQPGAWKTVHGEIMDLFKGPFGTDFATAGKNLGASFAKGLRDSFDEVRAASAALAQIVSDHVPHSPAKEGPLRQLPKWSSYFLAGLEPGMLAQPLAAALGGPLSSQIPASDARSTALSIASAQAQRDTMLLTEIRRQTAILDRIHAKDTTPIVQVTGGADANGAALAAKR